MRTVDPHADQTDVATASLPSRRWVLALVFGGCLIVDGILLAVVVVAWEEIAAFFSSDLFRAMVLGAGLVLLAWYYFRSAAAARKS